MTPFSTTNRISLGQEREVSQNPLLRAMKWFWRFSNFYGEYNSLPPSQRNRFVNEQIETRNKAQ